MPLLYQLPPNRQRSDEVLESFLIILPQGMKPVYIYFNNDAEAFAVRNATTIGDYLPATV